MKVSPFARFAWFVLVYNLGIILWGAYVRATGSGAGCGSHWPLCNGQVVPDLEHSTTIVEFAHRVSSGLALLLVLGLLVWAWRIYPVGSPMRFSSLFVVIFTIIEALIGAGLVLFELVADNESLARGVWMGLHLINTFLLLVPLTLTAWWSSGGALLQMRGQGVTRVLLGISLLALLVLGSSGAITALGDTLFPATSLAEGIAQDLSPTAHLFIQLRVFHPLIAVVVGAIVLIATQMVSTLRPQPLVQRIGWGLLVLYGLQLLIGVVNMVLMAPVWLQMVHLLLATLIWITLVLFAATALSERAYRETYSPAVQQHPLTS
ncbi:MAG: heme A synthase [Chloroflexaceae bacterium]|nr:heme A synthase [Chloroflexaceae bacterium]